MFAQTLVFYILILLQLQAVEISSASISVGERPLEKRWLAKRQAGGLAQETYDTGTQYIQSSYDFIIVGGTSKTLFSYKPQQTLTLLDTAGPAGMVLAERLTESGNQSVLLLEGGEVPPVLGNWRTPGAALLILGNANSMLICERPSLKTI